MSNTEQQIQEVNSDIEEIKRLLGQSNRSRVKQFLEVQQRRFETELITLKEKQEKSAATEKKPTEPVAAVAAAAGRTYTKEISLYAWDQSDKFVKIYVQNLDGVGALPSEQVRCSFEISGFTLEISNLKNVNYIFKRNRLLFEIKPEKSSFKVKSDSVVLLLAKAETKNWECILRDERKAPEKSAAPKMDDSKDPGDSLMQMMKNMYETGDDEMKRTIAKAWTESREKMNTGGGGDSGMPGMPGMPGF